MGKLKKFRKAFRKLSDENKKLAAKIIHDWEQDNRISLMLDKMIPELYEQVVKTPNLIEINKRMLAK